MVDLCFHTLKTLLMGATRKRRWPGVDTVSFQVLGTTEFKPVQHELGIHKVASLTKTFAWFCWFD
jgi:hypothetical protein